MRSLLTYIKRLRPRLVNLFLQENWMIGWVDQPIANSLRWRTCPEVNWIGQRSSGRYLADPFAWPGQPGVILCEEFGFESQNGTLRQLEVEGSAIRSDAPLPLSVPGHLSFPFLFAHGGETYLMPESCSARKLVIYKFNRSTKGWDEFVTPLADTPATDAILFEHEGRFWIAYTDVDIDRFDNLNLCYAPALAGPWTRHSGNPVKSDDARTARCGGTPFRVGGVLFRPAQDCFATYGGLIRIMEILECSPSAFREREVTHILPERGANPHGFHTLSAWGDRCLVDGKRMRFSLRHIAQKLLRRLRRLW